MNLSTLIQHAVSSSNAAIQKEAEQKLIEYLATNSQQFFYSLSQIIGEQNQLDIVRQAAGTIISRNLFSMTDDGLQYKWLTYQSSITQQIKSTLLATLGSSKQLPKRAASDVISKIAAIDVPLGKWNELIPALLNAANDNQIKNQRTAIMALGFVCVQFKQHKIAITHTQTQQIFTAIFIGLTNEHIQIKKEALIALTPCIIYVTEIFKNQKFRQKTVTTLLQCLRYQELVQHTLQVFLQYSKFYYVYLGQIIQYLYTHTQAIIESKGPNTIIAMELWHTIAETYLQKKGSVGIQNYILSLGDKLVKLLLTSLLFVDKDDDNNIRDSALSTLFPIAQGSEAICMQSVSSFVGNGIKSGDWKFRQAAIMAFSTITTSDNKVVKQWLQQGCDQFFNLLQDQDQFVVESTLIGLVKILQTSNNGVIILKKKNYKDYISILTKLLSKKENIVTKALQTLGKLTQHLSQNPTLDLTNNPFDLINIITQFMMKTPVPSYRQLQSASIVIVHLLQGNKSNKINKQYTEFLVIQSTKLRQNVEIQNNLKMCFFVILHTAVLSGKDPIDKTQSQALSALVHNHFQEIKSVDQDGLYIIGALALRMGQQFINHFPQFSPYITHGLGLKKQPATYKICLGVVCDIVKSIGIHIPNQCESYLTTFISQFQAQGDRNTKGSLITGIGDIIRDSPHPQLISKYKSQIIQIAQLSVSACIHLSSSNDDPDYAEQLKQILTDFLQCLCSGFGNEACFEQAPDILDIAMTFVLRTCNRQSNPTLSHFTKGLYLVFDAGSILVSLIAEGQNGQYYKFTKMAFQKPQFITIFNSLRDVPFNNQIKTISSYGRAVFGALKITNGVKYL